MKWLNWLIGAVMMMAVGSILRADEFDDRLARFAAETAKRKAKACDCNGPANCSCGEKAGDCICGPCLAAKAKAEAPKAKKAPLFYKHVCGCPSMGCNCAPLGGCHCSENALFNRVNPHWHASPSGGYSLWRGNEQLGYLDVKGVYHPLNADGEWCEPTKAPIPLPQQRSEAPRQQQACRT